MAAALGSVAMAATPASRVYTLSRSERDSEPGGCIWERFDDRHGNSIVRMVGHIDRLVFPLGRCR